MGWIYNSFYIFPMYVHLCEYIWVSTIVHPTHAQCVWGGGAGYTFIDLLFRIIFSVRHYLFITFRHFSSFSNILFKIQSSELNPLWRVQTSVSPPLFSIVPNFPLTTFTLLHPPSPKSISSFSPPCSSRKHSNKPL